MQLTKVAIRNFRSIKYVELPVKELTTLIGRNSAGKSNLLLAIRAFFTFSDKSLSLDDLYEHRDDEEDGWIECSFDRLTANEREELAKYILNDHTIRVRRTIQDTDAGARSQLRGYVAAPVQEWLREGFDRYREADFWASIGVNVFDYVEPPSGKTAITRAIHAEFIAKYIERHRDEINWSIGLSDTDFKGRQSAASAALPTFTFVPATGSVADQIVGRATSLLNIIVSDVLESARESQLFADAQQALEESTTLINPSQNRIPLVSQIESALTQALASWGEAACTIGTSTPNLKKVLLDSLRMRVKLDDHDGDLSLQGDGIQRQILFQVFRLYADFRARRGLFAGDAGAGDSHGSHIIALEEPELFLHPQAQEQFLDDLVTVSTHDQVMLSTHSNHLIDMERTDGLVVVRRLGSPRQTEINCADQAWCDDRDARTQVKDLLLLSSDMAKMFFADKIIICEGPADKILFMGTAQRYADCFTRRVAVVAAGSKSTIPRLQSVLNGFGIPYVAAFDADPGDASSEADTSRIIKLIDEANLAGCPARAEVFAPNVAQEAGYEEQHRDKPFQAFT